jgi:4a-hydroxytetrahydrobiopterin dehydratase
VEQPWRERLRPPSLERRYEFANYQALRDFLDRAAVLSETEGYFPDMGFGRDYVNVTIHADEESGTLTDLQRRFAERLDELHAADPAG